MSVEVPENAVARTALSRSDQFHSLVLDGLRDYAIFALDEDGVIASWNAGAQALSGYAPEQALGRRYADLFGPGASGVVRDALDVARTEGRQEGERWWRTRDGGLVWVDEVISVLEDTSGARIGFAVVTRDLTERRLAEDRHEAGKAWESEALEREGELRRELHIAERRAAYLAEASSILVASSLSFDSTIRALARLTVSRLADWCVIFELQDDGSLVRREIAHRDPRQEQALLKLPRTRLDPHPPNPVASVIRTGQSQTINDVSNAVVRSLLGELSTDPAAPAVRHLMVTPLHARGQVLGAVAFVSSDPGGGFEDDDLALAEELGRRAAIAMDNARLYHEAQEANRAKADFLAIMSHELRTPLNAIMGYSDLLDSEISGPMTTRQRKQVSRVRASARHLLQLIEEILSFARLEQGEEEVRLERVNAGEIAREAAALIEPMAIAKGLDLEVVQNGTAPMLETDAGKARQVLVNLLSNAVKFTEQGRVEIRVEAAGDNVVFAIRDTGAGIVPEMLDRVFDAFWQAERPNTRRVGGTGLGLTVSRRFVRLLRGDISVESKVGSGTTFHVRLPLRFPVSGPAGKDASSLAVPEPNL